VIELFVNLSEDQANLCLLILAASDIRAEVKKAPTGWKIHVLDGDELTALDAVKQYFRDNPHSDSPCVSSPVENWSFFSGWAVAFVLLAFYVAAEMNGAHALLVAEFGSSARTIVNGQWYRTITALMLHRDVLHLVGNMAAMIVFTSAVAAVTGGGVGGFMILLAGMTGNLWNAFFYRSSHCSVGASTAVFGAIGILAALGFGLKIGRSGRRLSACLPLFGGFCLLAFLGGPGERVDIMAHLFGFAAGIVIGLGYTVFRRQVVAPVSQAVCLMATLGMVAMAWLKLF